MAGRKPAAEKPEFVARFMELKPVGTEVRHLQGHWYVYEATSVYSREKKRPQKISGPMIGTLTPQGLIPSKQKTPRTPGKKPAPPPDPVIAEGCRRAAEIVARQLAMQASGEDEPPAEENMQTALPMPDGRSPAERKEAEDRREETPAAGPVRVEETPHADTDAPGGSGRGEQVPEEKTEAEPRREETSAGEQNPEEMPPVPRDRKPEEAVRDAAEPEDTDSEPPQQTEAPETAGQSEPPAPAQAEEPAEEQKQTRSRTRSSGSGRRDRGRKGTGKKPPEPAEESGAGGDAPDREAPQSRLTLTMLGTGHALASGCWNTCFVLRDGTDCLLVDGGGGNRLIPQIQAAGLDWRDMRQVFVTRGTPDRILGILWLVRLAAEEMLAGSLEGDMTILGSHETLYVLRQLASLLLSPPEAALLGGRIRLQPLVHGQTFTVLGRPAAVFDTGSEGARQFGFAVYEGLRIQLTCLGDEPCGPAVHHFVRGARWLLHCAFCLETDGDPAGKGLCTAAEACRRARDLDVENLILCHMEDRDLTRRKERYLQEGKRYFRGNLHAPDDLEIIQL